MRTRLVALGTLVAATAVAVSVGDVSGADGARRAQPSVSYLVQVTFSLAYANHWWTTAGDREDACNPWREDEGTNDVFVQNLGERAVPKQMPLRGQLAFGGAAVRIVPGAPSSWALLNVVGDARGTIRRRWEQDGGPETSPCGGRPVEPFRRLPDDCNRVSFATRAAVIRAELRRNWSGLFNLTHAREQGKPVVSVSVPLGNGAWRLPFDTCKTTPKAPELVANLGLPVRPKDIRALRTLGLGRTYRLNWEGRKKVFGLCDDEDPNTARNGCEFEVHGWIEIRHVRTFG
jgi:hypothetical protein